MSIIKSEDFILSSFFFVTRSSKLLLIADILLSMFLILFKKVLPTKYFVLLILISPFNIEKKAPLNLFIISKKCFLFLIFKNVIDDLKKDY